MLSEEKMLWGSVIVIIIAFLVKFGGPWVFTLGSWAAGYALLLAGVFFAFRYLHITMMVIAGAVVYFFFFKF